MEPSKENHMDLDVLVPMKAKPYSYTPSCAAQDWP